LIQQTIHCGQDRYSIFASLSGWQAQISLPPPKAARAFRQRAIPQQRVTRDAVHAATLHDFLWRTFPMHTIALASVFLAMVCAPAMVSLSVNRRLAAELDEEV
jgi:hypothetical protein